MPERDTQPDPMDKAYAQAEAMLSDEAARAARRARVLAAVAGGAAPAAPAEPAPAIPTTPAGRRGWRRGGWLMAAGVAGLTVLATQVYQPVRIPPPPAPAAPTTAKPVAPNAPPPVAPAQIAPAQISPAETPVARTPVEKSAPRPAAPVFAPALPAPPAAAPAVSQPIPPPPPLPIVQPPPRAAAPAPAPTASVSEIVTTASRRASTEAGSTAGRTAKSALAPAASSQIEEMIVVTGEKRRPPTPGARLRDAAAEDRTADLETLLAKGVPVDAADAEGETALMKAIAAKHPAAAALLRGHGASLDRKSRTGVSARDMATATGDAEMKRALGLEP